ncbi:MAG TPA: Gfo/Idh/MocA family oxidoreductase [Pirellulaceae bacterium]|nr:Gfo/Idh/MocA family oxidoreductase [Pirellulaceae bacterium]HMO91788.1 Gfo/Idh/MocA family oxidoreductase [Pirellulaceae bacterium]HMP69587.1 Gfo/Idh/MocA family oxidoreductase [Pirellulaceae bacterium]
MLHPLNRRNFLKTSSTVVAAGTVSGVGMVSANEPKLAGFHHSVRDTYAVGLIGCGGRGTAAAVNALKADSRVKITALADAFENRLETCLETLTLSEFADRIDVAKDRKFTGFQAYQQLLDTDIDVVLLCSPPHFRPAEMEAAVAAKKHIFCEKPIATDASGVRRVLQACEQAEKWGLNVVSGLCWRYDLGVTETMRRIKEGAIGDVLNIHSNYLTGELWHHPRKPEWSEMEYQCRNWLYFNWLSGDLLNEQHIHTIDKGLWLMDDEPPAFCYGTGGRQKRIGEQWGNVYDHFATVFEWSNGTKMFSFCRQMNDCFSENECHVVGSGGRASILRHEITDAAGETWKYRDRKRSMYDVEHEHLFKAISGDLPYINNGRYMCQSTLACLMGRDASYTGRKITWDEALNDEKKLGPESYAWGDYKADPVAIPGSGRS